MQKRVKSEWKRGGFAVVLLFPLGGCTQEIEFDKIASTDRVDYYVEVGAEELPCEGTADWVQRYYDATAKFLGVSLSAGEKIEYHYLRNPLVEQTGCKRGVACAQGNTIYSQQFVGTHEIVHAAASKLGDPPLLFQHGLEEVLGCQSITDGEGPINDDMPFFQMLDPEYFEAWVASGGYPFYSEIGAFVRFIIDQHGWPKFLSFYANTPRHASRAEMEASFEKEFGVTFKSVRSDWFRAPMPFMTDMCVRLMECDESTPELLSNDIDFSCGPQGYAGEAITRFTIAADRAAHLITEAGMSDPQLLSYSMVERCSGGSFLPVSERTAGLVIDENRHLVIDPAHKTHQWVIDAPPGEYMARFSAGFNETPLLHAEVLQTPSLMRDACAPAAEPLVIADNQFITLSSRWQERPCNGFWCPGYGWDVKIGPQGGALEAWPVVINGRAMYSPNKIYLCTDPCPTNISQCEMLTFDIDAGVSGKSTQVFAPGTVVHVGAPVSPYDEHFSLRMRIAQP